MKKLLLLLAIAGSAQAQDIEFHCSKGVEFVHGSVDNGELIIETNTGLYLTELRMDVHQIIENSEDSVTIVGMSNGHTYKYDLGRDNSVTFESKTRRIEYISSADYCSVQGV